jgi:DNA repair protein RadC
MTTLYVRDQSGFREAQPADVLDRAQALLAQRYRVGAPVLTSPTLTREFLRVHLGTCEHEVFGVLHLRNLTAPLAGPRSRSRAGQGGEGLVRGFR